MFAVVIVYPGPMCCIIQIFIIGNRNSAACKVCFKTQRGCCVVHTDIGKSSIPSNVRRIRIPGSSLYIYRHCFIRRHLPCFRLSQHIVMVVYPVNGYMGYIGRVNLVSIYHGYRLIRHLSGKVLLGIKCAPCCLRRIYPSSRQIIYIPAACFYLSAGKGISRNLCRCSRNLRLRGIEIAFRSTDSTATPICIFYTQGKFL